MPTPPPPPPANESLVYQKTYMKQRVIVCAFHKLETEINQILKEGWLVKFMCAEGITDPYRGRICIIFEKEHTENLAQDKS